MNLQLKKMGSIFSKKRMNSFESSNSMILLKGSSKGLNLTGDFDDIG